MLNFRLTLLSISAFLKHSICTMAFTLTSLLIQDRQHSKTIGRADLHESLYVLDVDSSSIASHGVVVPLDKFVSCINASFHNMCLLMYGMPIWATYLTIDFFFCNNV